MPVGFTRRESALCTWRCLCNANQGTRSGDNQGIRFKSKLSSKLQYYHRHSHTHIAFLGKQVSNEQIDNQQGMSTNSSQRSPLYKVLLPSEIQVPASVTSSSETSGLKGLNSSKGRGDASVKRPHVKSCCLTSKSTLCWWPPPSWWLADLPSTEGHLPAIPGCSIPTLLYLISTQKGLLLSTYC